MRPWGSELRRGAENATVWVHKHGCKKGQGASWRRPLELPLNSPAYTNATSLTPTALKAENNCWHREHMCFRKWQEDVSSGPRAASHFFGTPCSWLYLGGSLRFQKNRTFVEGEAPECHAQLRLNASCRSDGVGSKSAQCEPMSGCVRFVAPPLERVSETIHTPKSRTRPFLRHIAPRAWTCSSLFCV